MRKDGGFDVRRSFILGEHSILRELLSFRLDGSVQNLIITDSSHCFIIKVIWMHHTIGEHGTPE